MRTELNTIAYGGDGQPKLTDIVDFLAKFSENVANVEISGFEALTRDTKQSVVIVEAYKDNSWDENFGKSYGLNNVFRNTFVKGHFHTHPSNTGSPANIDKPSQIDLDSQKVRNKNSNRATLPHYIYNIHGRIPYN